jgi:hypothetical protein
MAFSEREKMRFEFFRKSIHSEILNDRISLKEFLPPVLQDSFL